MKPGSNSSTIKDQVIKFLLNVASVPIGRRFVNYLNEMERVQWYSTEELLARSEERLGTLLKHAAESVPLYRELYQQRGLNADALRSINDLQQLPIFTKSDYRKCEPETLFATNVPASLLIHRATSGSTGEPFKFSLDRRALPIIFASHLFYDSWHGLQPFDRYVRIIAPPALSPPLPSNESAAVKLRRQMTTHFQTLYESWTQEKISLWEINSENAENVWRRIEAFHPKFVMGYTSSLAAIADELLRRDLKLSCPIEGVITIAETLTPNRKKLIRGIFQCADHQPLWSARVWFMERTELPRITRSISHQHGTRGV